MDIKDLRTLYGRKCHNASRKAIAQAKTIPDFQKQSGLMKVKNFVIPDGYLEFASRYISVNGFCNFILKDDADSYGNCLETELATVYTEQGRLEVETAKLTQDFSCDGYYGKPDDVYPDPGRIADIVDFSKIVCFGMAGDDSPFCFDYRGCASKPSVVWWNDDHWRRLSDSFEDFIALFKSKAED